MGRNFFKKKTAAFCTCCACCCLSKGEHHGHNNKKQAEFTPTSLLNALSRQCPQRQTRYSEALNNFIVFSIPLGAENCFFDQKIHSISSKRERTFRHLGYPCHKLPMQFRRVLQCSSAWLPPTATACGRGMRGSHRQSLPPLMSRLTASAQDHQPQSPSTKQQF